MANPWLILPVCYLIGAIPFSYMVVRHARGLDLRHEGIGNLGTLNATLVGGLRCGLPVLAGDVGKGVLAALLSQWAFGPGPWALFGVAAAILGHNLSVFVGFAGGKGIAALVGALSLFTLPTVFAGAALIPLLLAVTENVQLTVMILSASLPALLGLWWPGPVAAAAGFAIALLILLKFHIMNHPLWRRRMAQPLARSAACLLLVALVAAGACSALVTDVGAEAARAVLGGAAAWVTIATLLLAAWGVVRRDWHLGLAFVVAALVAVAVGLVATAGHGSPVGLWRPVADGAWTEAARAVAPWKVTGAHHILLCLAVAAGGLVRRLFEHPSAR